MIFRKIILILVFTILFCASCYAYDINLLTDIPVKGDISAITLNTATDIAATISESEKSLTIINIATDAVVHEISVPATPSAIAILKSSNKVVVSSLEGSLYLYDIGSGDLAKTIDTETPVYAIEVDETNNTAVLGVDGGIRIIDLTSGKELSAINISGETTRLCLGRTVLTVASSDANGAKLRTINLKTGTVVKETSLSGDAASIALDESLGYVLVTQIDRTGLILYDASTLQEVCDIQTGKKVEIVSVNTSTHMAVLSDTQDGSLSVVGLETKVSVGTLALFEKTGPVVVDVARNIAFVAHDNGLTVVKLENPVPSLTDLIPTSMASTGDVFPLSLIGSKFIKDSRTWFNNKPADTIFTSNEFLTANILPDELIYPGTVSVSVFNPTPGGGMSNELNFKILTPVPRISALSPDTVAVGNPALTLKVEGKNFLPDASVSINGQKSSVRFISSILLEVVVNSSLVSTIGSYPVTVTNTGPTTATSNTVSFNVATAEDVASSQNDSALSAPQGTGTLFGKILNTDMQPVKGVTIRYKALSAITDDTGSFTLNNIPAGRRTILIDGSTAIDPIGHMPTIPISADITANIKNSMPFTPYLHRQKNHNFVKINPAKDTILTDPELPGFEMRIPQGVNIIGWDHKANLKVSVRTVPSDRLPVKPLPKNSYVKTVYMFYFNKVGGGRPDRPIPIKSPNDLGLLPGEKAVLWYYDESPNEGEAPNDWAIAGTGTVTPDGRFIVTDPGVGIPKFCCGATGWGGQSASLPTSSKDCGGQAADPVDVTTGFFMHEKTDFVIPGIIPVKIKHYYRSRDSGNAVSGSTGLGTFGKGMYFEYDWWLGSYQSMLRLTKPGTYHYDFALQADGSYMNSADPEFRAAKITTNADGTKTLRMRDGHTYKFDTGGSLIEIADRNGNKVTIQRHSYYEGGYITSITTAEGHVVTFTQNYTHGYFQTDAISDDAGRSVSFIYEADPFSSYPRLKQVGLPDGSTMSYGYDSSGRMNTITNGRGIVEVTNVYDSSNRVISQTHADGGTYAFDYGTSGQTKMTVPNGAQTIWSYNGYGYITSKITSDGITTYNKASGTNELSSVTDPLDRTTSYTYYSTNDAKDGLVHTVTDPLNNVTTYDYETNYGLPTSITDALQKTTTFTYTPSPTTTPPTRVDIRDPIQSQNPQLQPTTVNFNSYGMPVSIVDANSNTTTLTFDTNNHGQLTKVTDALNNSVSYAYDSGGRVSSFTDAKGATTKYDYDPMNRISSVTDAINGSTWYLYDGNGNLVTLINAKGNPILYEYDNRDRITKMTDQLGRYETYAYYTGSQIAPATGDNLMSYTDRKGQVTTFDQYDPMNRLLKVTYNDSSYLQYTYDAVGRATNIYDSITGAIARTYNDYGCSSCSGRGLDLVSQEVTPLSIINYTYDADGRRSSMTVDGEPIVNYTYDDAGRLTNLSRVIGSASRTYNLGYDNAGRRTSLQIPLANGTDYVSTIYGYDNANRLLSMIQQGPSGIIENLVYGYDANGSRTSFARNAAQTLSPAVNSTSHDDANEMLALDGKSFTYDQNGNLSTGTDANGTTNYTWDARNRLIAIDGPSITASFSYDALNRRISKTINGTTTQFVYDGWDIIQDIQDGVKTNYVRTLNIDEPLTRMNSTTTRHYVRNALGSIVALADDMGVAKTTYVYDVFGNVTASGESSDNPFQYTGRENDGTGLYYYRARYFSPEMQRFISEDPIRLRGGINYFTYVQNSPVNRTDPNGLKDPFGALLDGYGTVDLLTSTDHGAAYYGGIAGSIIGGGAALFIDQPELVPYAAGLGGVLGGNIGGWLAGDDGFNEDAMIPFYPTKIPPPLKQMMCEHPKIPHLDRLPRYAPPNTPEWRNPPNR